jgi:hypothetical protein
MMSVDSCITFLSQPRAGDAGCGMVSGRTRAARRRKGIEDGQGSLLLALPDGNPNAGEPGGRLRAGARG